MNITVITHIKMYLRGWYYLCDLKQLSIKTPTHKQGPTHQLAFHPHDTSSRLFELHLINIFSQHPAN